MGQDMITVRRLGPDDAETMVRLEAANQPQPWSRGIIDDELAAENRIYLGVDLDADSGPGGGELVAFGGVMVVGDEAHITNLLVDPQQQRRGHGARLLSELIRAAVVAGARHLTLEVRTKNHEARRLYSRHGLAPVGVRPGYYGDDDALILWAHDIDQPEYLERLG